MAFCYEVYWNKISILYMLREVIPPPTGIASFPALVCVLCIIQIVADHLIYAIQCCAVK